MCIRPLLEGVWPLITGFTVTDCIGCVAYDDSGYCPLSKSEGEVLHPRKI